MRNCSRLASIFMVLVAVILPGVALGQETTQIQTEIRTSRIEAKGIVYRTDPRLSRGQSVKTPGSPGSVRKEVRVTYVDSKPVKFEVLKETKTPATPTIIRVPLGIHPRGVSSRSSYVRGRVLTMHASAYDPSPATIGRGATGRCANGMRAGFGVVAVDPRVIPLGTPVFIEGYGLAIAADTGGAIKGHRIDLCFNSRSQAIRFGRKKVRVHVLRKR